MHSIRSLSLLFAVFFVNPTLHAEELAANNVDDTGFESSGLFRGVGYSGSPDFTNEAVGQEFSPSISGKLTTLVASVELREGGEPLEVSVYTAVLPGVPNVLLGSTVVPESEVDGAPFNTFDLSNLNIELRQRSRYIVTFRTATAIAGSIRYKASLVALNENSFGFPSIFSRDGGENWEIVPPEWRPAPEIGVMVFVDTGVPQEPVEVAIDVDPTSTENQINLKTKNPKPLDVAMLGSSSFDALTTLPATALLGDPILTDPVEGLRLPASPTDFRYDDVNGDGHPDVVFTFLVSDLKLLGAIDELTSELLLSVEVDANGSLAFGLDGVNQKGDGGGKGNGIGNGKNK